jgi:hypothetical protein
MSEDGQDKKRSCGLRTSHPSASFTQAASYDEKRTVRRSGSYEFARPRQHRLRG